MTLRYLALALGTAAACALLWLLRRPQRHRSSASPLTTAALRQLRTSELIRLVGLAFQARGFHVVESGTIGARVGGAVDIELRKDREAYLVHCKHWRSRKIDVDAVRAFHTLMTERRAAGGFIVTTGRFSRDATHYVRGISLSLVDGTLLGPMLDEGRRQPATAGITSATLPPDPARPVEWAPVSVLGAMPDVLEDTFDLTRQPAADLRKAAPPASTPPPSPRCPLCTASMVLRTAPPGRHAGRGFWRCSRHRDCKGMRPLV